MDAQWDEAHPGAVLRDRQRWPSHRGAHLLLAGITGGVTWLASIVAAEPSSRSPEIAGPLLAVALAAMVLVATRRPLPALAVSALGVVLYHVADFPAIGLAWPLAPVLYLVAAAGAAIPAGIALGAMLLGAVGWRLLAEQESLLIVVFDGFVREAGLVAIALLLGEVVHRRAVWRREVELRLEAQARERRRELDRHLGEQRLALAREVHDTVAHTLAVVGVQADVAAATVHGDAVRAAEAIEVVRRTSRRALDELRTTVSLLRGDAPDLDGRRPVPGLAELATLVGHVETSGLRVEVEVADDLGALPTTLDTTAYRVVQEALTNVVRHAAASSARVALWRDDEVLHVEVTDDGAATPSPAAVEAQGNGLRGMRERASALGGELRAGPEPAGGFRVHLAAPLQARP